MDGSPMTAQPPARPAASADPKPFSRLAGWMRKTPDAPAELVGWLPEVSPQPRLLVELSRPLAAREWHVLLDGETLGLAPASAPLRQLELTLPGPLHLGSRHQLQVRAGGATLQLTFQVVPPLDAALTMRFAELLADVPPSVMTSARFSRPVRDRAQAQARLRIDGGETGYQWADDQTLQGITRAPLGSRVSATLDEGVEGPGGSFTQGVRTASLEVPVSLTSVPSGRMVQMYYVDTNEARSSFYAHINQITMLSPQWYEVAADGSITGSARRDIIDVAHAHGVQIVPLVMNADVDQQVAHALLSDPAARAAFVGHLVAEARRYGYGGFQLDLEQLLWTDRDLYTALVEEAAPTFRRSGLTLAVAVVPRLAGDEEASGARLDYFRNWSGAYDFARLARAADFLSLMTYDEHNGVTPPGPIASLPWMRRALEFSLQDVPPEKVALGLPTYYRDWNRYGRNSSSSYEDALILATRFGATPVFDPVLDELHFTYRTVSGVDHELWFENAETLRRKLPLMHEFGLRGISVWRLGLEDRAFWSLIPPRR